MHKNLTLDTVDEVVAQDLRATARAALARGESVEFYLHPAAPGVPGCILVETVVVGDRAGQVTNGNAVWGDWFALNQSILLDDLGPEGEVLRAGLDGVQRPVAKARPMGGFSRGDLTVLFARSNPKTQRFPEVDLFASMGATVGWRAEMAVVPNAEALSRGSGIDLDDPSHKHVRLSEKTMARIEDARRLLLREPRAGGADLRVVKSGEDAVREFGFHFEMGPERSSQIEIHHTPRPLLRVRCSLSGVEFSAAEVLFVVGDAGGVLPPDRAAREELVREHGHPGLLTNGGRDLQAWAPARDGGEPRWVPVELLP